MTDSMNVEADLGLVYFDNVLASFLHAEACLISLDQGKPVL